MLKEILVVLCLMLAIVAAYPGEDVKNDHSVSAESDELSSEELDLNGAESRHGWGGFYGGGRGFGHYGGFGHGLGLGFGRGFGFGHGGFGHGWRHWG